LNAKNLKRRTSFSFLASLYKEKEEVFFVKNTSDDNFGELVKQRFTGKIINLIMIYYRLRKTD
jgi:hypothetical protein